MVGDLMRTLLVDLHVQGAAVTRQPSLVLYAYDVTTGVVVDIGDRLNIVPVIDGALHRMQSHYITDHLRLCRRKCHYFTAIWSCTYC
jgi:actin beta/gamma 1